MSGRHRARLPNFGPDRLCHTKLRASLFAGYYSGAAGSSGLPCRLSDGASAPADFKSECRQWTDHQQRGHCRGRNERFGGALA